MVKKRPKEPVINVEITKFITPNDSCSKNKRFTETKKERIEKLNLFLLLERCFMQMKYLKGPTRWKTELF